MIREFKLFDGVNAGLVKNISHYFSDVQSCEADQYLMESGDGEDSVYFLLSGCVRLSLMSNEGHFISYKNIEPNDYFGWLSAIDGGLRITSAVVMESSTFMTVNADNFHKILLSDPKIHRNFLKRVGHVVRRYTDRIQKLTIFSARERVLAEFERLFEESGNPIQIKNHENLATWAGTTRETVTRAIKEFEKEQLIKRKNDGYHYLSKS